MNSVSFTKSAFLWGRWLIYISFLTFVKAAFIKAIGNWHNFAIRETQFWRAERAGVDILLEHRKGWCYSNLYFLIFFFNLCALKAGALLACGIVNSGVRNECDPALALLCDHVMHTNTFMRIGAISGWVMRMSSLFFFFITHFSWLEKVIDLSLLLLHFYKELLSLS